MAVVLITGCSSGFGKLASLEFARKGDHVFASMRDTSKAGELEQAKAAEDLRLDVVPLDVTDEASVKDAVARVLAKAGRIDVLVNNAGIGHHGPLEETDDAEVREIFDTNFFGALNVMRAVAPVMREQKSGTIVNVSSLNGVVSPPFQGVYGASKFALEAASEAAYYELHPFGVRVCIVEPGGFETNIENTRRTSRRFTEGSPYLDFERRFAEALTRLPAAEARRDAQEVAVMIYTAVYDKEPKLRYLVGQDAVTIGAVRRQLDDQQFEQSMRQALDFWD
jgi:NAD(P)-dependent dehydrogenase (short-subunit alcohol dehydrogenase family)